MSLSDEVENCSKDLRVLEEEDEYDSEGFLIAPRPRGEVQLSGVAGDNSFEASATPSQSNQGKFIQCENGTAETPPMSANPILRAWGWKREHLSDLERFTLNYEYPFGELGSGSGLWNTRDMNAFATKYPCILSCKSTGSEDMISIKQMPFDADGFASTVWDSSIVMSKYIEKWPEKFRGRRCLELGAGCGLVGIVLSKVGASVTVTDLECNLPLLQENTSIGKDVDVQPLVWGTPSPKCSPPYDVIVGCDIMYIREAIPDLVDTLMQLSDSKTKIIFSYGRNRFAEETFFDAITSKFTMMDVPESDLHTVYQCADVRVFTMQRV